MKKVPQDIKSRLLYIIHRGFVEIRLLSQAQKNDQVYYLADVMELLPKYLNDWKDEYYETIYQSLNKYNEKYPDSRFYYVKFLDEYKIPQF